MSELATRLKTLQANVFQMYAQAHGYHWNVEGMLFKELHAFFLEIYEDVFGAIDPISENLRKLDDTAPFGAKNWLQNATVYINDNEVLSPVEMLNALASTNESIIAELKIIFKVADAADEQGIANFIAERIDQHQFWRWQIKSTLKKVVI
jgi:starvation-inducible DNA-binding protein